MHQSIIKPKKVWLIVNLINHYTKKVLLITHYCKKFEKFVEMTIPAELKLLNLVRFIVKLFNSRGVASWFFICINNFYNKQIWVLCEKLFIIQKKMKSIMFDHEKNPFRIKFTSLLLLYRMCMSNIWVTSVINIIIPTLVPMTRNFI